MSKKCDFCDATKKIKTYEIISKRIRYVNICSACEKEAQIETQSDIDDIL